MLDRIDRIIGGLAFAIAMAGGAVLIAVTLLTCVSVIGRALDGFGLGPVPGDYELVAMGAAFAVTACLPWCQWRRGHVTVDLLLQGFGPRVNAGVDVVANLLMTAAAGLLAWRLWAGLIDKIGTAFYRETTFILGLPVWWGYAGALVGAAAFALVSAWTVVRSLREALA
jgi:TRAP-type C4-dicarboxylate transport system permease small subunit